MGRVTGGPFGTFIGKVGNVVGYVRLGTDCVRNLPIKSNKPRTQGQREVNHKFQMGRELISQMQEFINVGYRIAAEGTGKTAQNLATSWIIKEVISGEHPNFEMDYSQLMLSKGDLPLAEQPVVEYVYPNLRFQWTVPAELDLKYERDQVMMLAYHPNLKHTSFTLSGNRRKVGEDELFVTPMADYKEVNPEDDFVETYISFISDDRRRISDSIYTGRVYL
ncbi:DUF6266 family protein [Pedobacter gandavensis]|uniref:DUF6266 family protein n=1 Tax=Pedobacter gandavensis TaxID=2679963 RepID=UPI002930D41E|nr:DUF6266 family protein [Pedobacter gandavensis]